MELNCFFFVKKTFQLELIFLEFPDKNSTCTFTNDQTHTHTRSSEPFKGFRRTESI